MQSAHRFPRLPAILILVLVLLTVFTLAISAQSPDNGEPGGGGPSVVSDNADHVEETGVQSQELLIQVGGNGEPENPAPKEVTPVDEIELSAGMDDPGMATFFKRWPAETFTAYDETNAWAYEGGGCISRTGGQNFWDTSVQLPDGAEIDFLRVYYFDEDPNVDADAILFEFDDTGGNITIATAEGSGTPGFSSAGSDFFSHFVDNQDKSYVVRIDFNGGATDSLQICAVRIRYQYTITSINLPTILNSTNP
jgi:hypothetical protein